MSKKKDISEVLAHRIQQAIENNDLSELQDCLEHRDFREMNFLDIDEDINRRVVKPLTVYAAEHGTPAILKMLLEYGCDANARDSLGNTPLLTAIAQEKTAMVRFLLKHPDVHADVANDYGEDIYSIAELNGNKEILAYVETVLEPEPVDPRSVHFRFTLEGTGDVIGFC